ncbi:MAG: glycosyltransferase [Syntrophomonadaceae bacterium]|nr:glycosyltransferase [Syntrophomonadaceae bacterium]
MKNPKVSVLMPVYNGERYLPEAIDSIINQTMPDFEFIIVLDPSDDDSKNIAESYTDSRIILIKNVVKQGLARSLNQGLLIASGKYVARMDADDISVPERLERQFDFMERNPGIGISGTSVKTIGNHAGMVINHTSDPEMIRSFMLFQPHMTHPTVIMRRSLIEQYNFSYDPTFARAEDYKLWSIYSRLFPLSNLNEVLLFYRLHTENAQKLDFAEHQKFAGLVRLEELSRLGIAATDQEFALHQALSILRFVPSVIFAADCRQWLNKLEKANQNSHYYPEPAFSKSLQYLWIVISRACKITNP